MDKFKKIISLALSLMLILSLAACGSNKEKNKDDSGDLKVDEGIINVEITLPANMFEGESSDEIKASAEEEGLNCTVNEDGSVTLKMTKAKRNELLKEMSDSFDSTAQEIIDEGSSSFKEVTHNKDFTLIKIKVEAAAYEESLDDAFNILSFLMMGAYYQLFNGVNDADLDVICTIYDNSTGNEIESMSFDDLLSDTTE